VMATIAVVGTGYVGLAAGACLAELGHRVHCSDVDGDKVRLLRAGNVDIVEPGLGELVRSGLANGRLSFLTTPTVSDADFVFLCVPTPMAADGGADLGAVTSVVHQIRDQLPSGCVLVNKSTVPVGTAAMVSELLNGRVPVVSNPEFLREGSAVHDFLHPDRIVVGSDDPTAARRVAELYAALHAPVLVTSTASAELIKYAANSFLAVKLSYANAIAELCERLGADVADVVKGVGQDHRIGESFLRAGPGWGGSCLPKDTSALLRTASAAGQHFSLLEAAIVTNARQRERVVAKIRGALGGELRGARICLLGLAFKAGTNDMRDSPALAVAAALAAEGAELTGYDPVVTADVPGLRVVDDPYEAVKDAGVVVLLTEWPEFRGLEWTAIRALAAGDVVVDARNHLDPDAVTAAGMRWRGIGCSRGVTTPDT
jgi:UDPglucose 6-dehydrogenase